MKKRIYRSLCAAFLGVALLCTTLLLLSFYNLLLSQARTDLKTEYAVLQRHMQDQEIEDNIDYLRQLDSEYFTTRMTLVDDQGHVLYDTSGAALENHLDRPEIQAAFQAGSGFALRESDTMGFSTYYYAARLKDGHHVLRIAKQTSSVVSVFMSIVPVVVLIILFVLVLSMLMASFLTKRTLQPIEHMANELESGGPSKFALAGYEELDPFFRKISAQNRLIKEQMAHLREERDKINTITSNMREGMILLDMDENVLSVNPSALELLCASGDGYAGQKLLRLSRSETLQRCVQSAANAKAADELLERNGRWIRVYASPVLENAQASGVIVLLMDVTQEHRAEVIRREFTATVSHELKTPLTSISGFAEMLANGMAENEQDTRNFARRIYQEAQRLIALTEDIMRLSRIEADGAPVELADVDLLEVCRRAAQSLEMAAESKRVQMRVQGEEAVVHANARMMEDLLLNLMENAVKYNREGGSVTVTLHKTEGNVVLTVADTGIGIPKEHQERIFERFYRVDESRFRQTGGTGLGLSIVRHIVQRHNGSIMLASMPGEGTVITVSLPVGGDS